MKYDVNYFIKKFESIPDDKWCTKVYSNAGRHCALGHCGIKDIESENDHDSRGRFKLKEPRALDEIFRKRILHVDEVNDSKEYIGNTPKERILNALYAIKAKKKNVKKHILKQK